MLKAPIWQEHLLKTTTSKYLFKEFADVYVINTCTVTQVAEKKCRNAIRVANHINPNATIAVIGCFAQLSPKEISEIDGVDIILGNADKHKLFEYIERKDEFDEHFKEVVPIDNVKEFVPSYSFEDRTRSFLKNTRRMRLFLFLLCHSFCKRKKQKRYH